MKDFLRILMFSAALVSLSIHSALAGVITQVHFPAADVVLPDPINPNNDGVATFFQNQTTWDVTLDSSLNYLDVVIDVSDSGGTTEYFVNTDVHVPTTAVGRNLQRFELQIVGVNLPTGLNFDTDDGDAYHGRGLQALQPDSVTDHVLLWNNVEISVYVPEIFHELDIPDSNPLGGGNYSFTLRYYPVVPEPATGACGIWAMTMLGMRHRPYRFSNQR